MRVFLDENPCPVITDSVTDAIDKAAALARENGRLIIEINVDGHPWSSEDALNTAEEVRLVTIETSSLLEQIEDDAADALADAQSLQQSAAEQLQAGQAAMGIEELGRALEIWQSLQEAVIGFTNSAGLDLEQLTVEGQPVQARLARLNEHLQHLRQSLIDNDPVRLADVLLYDMPDAADHWRQTLHAMLDAVKAEIG